MVEEVSKSSDDQQHDNNIPNAQSPEDGEVANNDDKPATEIVAPLHPLEHSWTFWFDNPSAKSRQAAWGSSIRPIYTFSTVEQFWSVYNNIHHPSKLVVGADFHCFKYKIEPKWEDPVCANGGKWTVSFSRGKSDTCWLYTLLAVIGEQFDNGDQICGAVVNVRARQEKVALWTKNATNESAQSLQTHSRVIVGQCFWPPFSYSFTIDGGIVWFSKHGYEISIGRQWKEFLDYNDTIGYIFHEDAKRLDRNAKNRYTV